MTVLCLLLVVCVGVIVVLVTRSGTTKRPRSGRQVVHYAQPARPARRRKKKPAPAPGGGQTLYTEAQVRAILEKALGAVWEAEQKRVHAQVKDQERKVAARLRQQQRELDFAELRGLHEKSRQTADLAYTMLGDARSAENKVRENIRAIEAATPRGGGNAGTRHALEALRVDRDVLRVHRERYEQDVQRLNRETARLRDAIGANCGTPGRKWHSALMERTRRRKEQRG
ncbi:hypothetical protein Aab01nite_49380 [Paractinoplanes abujensis]|uniref:Uncharacterized protein n=1 Tax=Paractinoplanes abujensis TaxID=882441 RepID=A0A7W7CVD4_9ACTN|nr:hypothetical protein [Actinoplanes abujensis]MBB4693993.1 hypothetical protein [Actinoplanes abujensis]GID21348.1 hypothetical protein Aab01nite_49380 [Actinoplanes abujensis]